MLHSNYLPELEYDVLQKTIHSGDPNDPKQI